MAVHSNLAGPDIRPCERGKIERKLNPEDSKNKEKEKREKIKIGTKDKHTIRRKNEPK